MRQLQNERKLFFSVNNVIRTYTCNARKKGCCVQWARAAKKGKPCIWAGVVMQKPRVNNKKVRLYRRTEGLTDRWTKRGVGSLITRLKTAVRYEVIHSKKDLHSALGTDEQISFWTHHCRHSQVVNFLYLPILS